MITRGLGSTLVLRGFAYPGPGAITLYKEELGERRGHRHYGDTYNLSYSLEKYTLGKVR